MAVLTIKKEKFGAFLFLIFCIGYGLEAYRIPVMFFAEVFTPRTLPYALCGSGIIVSLAMLLTPATVDPEGRDDSLSGALKGLEWKKVGALMVMMVLYGLTIKVIGFILSTIIFLAIGFRILGERSIKRIVLVSVPLVIGFWFIMTQLLEVYLAPGDLFYYLGGTS